MAFRKALIVKHADVGISQHRKNTLGIMRAQKIHQGITNRFGIGRIQFCQTVIKGARIPLFDKRENGVTQRIVHNAVKLFTSEITTALSISNFFRCILPHLANDNSLPSRRALNGGTQKVEKIIRKFVRHVQSPAADSLSYIGLGNAIRARQKATARLRLRVEFGQNFNAPPRLIGMRERIKAIPVIIWRLLRLIGSHAVVFIVTVEVTAVIARVVKNAVKDQAHTVSLCFLNQMIQRRIAAEHFVHFHVIACVILMIGIGFEDRTEVQCRDTEGSQIIQLFGNTPQVSAKKLVIGNRSSRIRGKLFDSTVPIVIYDRIVTGAYRSLSTEKTIHKNVIHGAAGKPCGHAKIRPIDQKVKFTLRMLLKRNIHIIVGL